MKPLHLLTLTASLLLAAPLARGQVVTTTADAGAGSLRAVVDTAGPGATITFTNTLSGLSIQLDSTLVLNNNLTIDASALPGGIKILGSGGALEVAAGRTVVLRKLELRNGTASGIYNAGTLTLDSCTVANNGDGTPIGGGYTSEGGGIYNAGTLTLNQCTLTDNFANTGAAIYNRSGANLAVNQCTISGNNGVNGTGGIRNLGSLTLANTILANNGTAGTSDPNLAGSGAVTLLGNNLISGDPLLAPLGNYGGPTQTMPPLIGSPAIDGGDDAAAASFATDQRGLPRRVRLQVDIGAAEWQLPVLVVTNLADSGPGSLRATVAGASLGALITFTNTLSGQTLTLTSGQIALNSFFSIDASALPGGVTIAGNGNSRLFTLGASGNATFVGLTLTNGWAANDHGGAIYNGGVLTVDRCTVAGSTAGLDGGGIFNPAGSQLTLLNSTFTGNTAREGGAVRCTGATFAATNCTFTANTASIGGACSIADGGPDAQLSHLTVVGNQATNLDYGGGGLFFYAQNTALQNSIIAGNTAPTGPDIATFGSTISPTGTNLLGNLAGSGLSAGPSVIIGNPLLASLGNYGGPTRTMPPQAGSPAIDAGSGSTLTSDQRGYPRIIGPAADLGAVEFFLTNAVVSTPADGGVGSLRFAVEHGSPAASNTVTFAPSLTGQTILLTSGQLYLKASFTVDASALASPVQINATRASRIFYVESNATVVLKSLLLTNGLAAGAAGTNATSSGQFASSGAPGLGGGIYNAGLLTLDQVTVAGSAAVGGLAGVGYNNVGRHGENAPGLGGGIYNAGGLTLHRSLLAGNSASAPDAAQVNEPYPYRGGDGLGGGIYNAGTLTLNQSTLMGNAADAGNGGPGGYYHGGGGGRAQGGGIYNAGTLTLNQSSLLGDAALAGNGGGAGSNGGAGGSAQGGGIYNSNACALILNQVTLAEASAQGGVGGNSGGSGGSGGAAQGGAIYNAGGLTVNQSTLTGNAATNGIGGTGSMAGTDGPSEAGGIYGYTTFALFNTIAAGNFALSDTNLFGAFSATGSNLTNGVPLLAPVGNYGGPTPTRPPLTGSPALDAGSDVATNAPYFFATDQRGLPRRSGAHVDIGAVELVLGPPAITALSATVIGTNPATGVFSVQLAASVNPNSELSTTVHFEYGLTASYAGSNGPLFVPAIYTPIHPTNLTVVVGLNSGFTYHWRAVAANTVGTNATPDQTFYLPAPGLSGDQNGDGLVSQSELDAVYANYLPTSPWLFMTNVAGLGGTNVTFALEGSPLGAYTVEYSTNLANWFPLGPATPRYGFTDTNAPALPQRHYRLRYP